MKNLKFFIILLLNILFVACSTAPQTAQPSLETATVPIVLELSKTPTPRLIKTPTATEATLSPREQEFLDQGFDKLSSLETGVIYGILDESSVKYMPDGGVKVEADDQTGYALSTAEVSYYNPESKKFEKGRFVIDWAVPTDTDDGSFITYPVDGGSAGSTPIVLPQAMIKDFRQQYFNFTPEKTPFVKIMFNFNVPGVDPINKFLAEAFPEFKGKIQVVDIPGVGKVLAIKGVLPEGYPGW